MVWKSADLTLDYLLRLNEDRISGIHSETSQNVKPTDIGRQKEELPAAFLRSKGTPDWTLILWMVPRILAMLREMRSTASPSVNATKPCNQNQAFSLEHSLDCPLRTRFQKTKNNAFSKVISCVYYYFKSVYIE